MLRFLLEKEFKQIFRDSFLPYMIIAMPIVMMLLFPWVANLEIRGVKLSVVDNDRSSYSERLIEKVISSGYFELTDYSSSNSEAMESIEAGSADVILEIADRFEQDLNNGYPGSVMILANSVNGTKGGLASSYLSSILADFSVELREEFGGAGAGAAGAGGTVAGGAGAAVAMAEVPTFSILPHYKFNPHLNFKVYMVPAIIVLLLTLMGGFLPALNVVNEKEIGTIEQINVTPVNKALFILAKLIPYWIIGFVALVISIGLSLLVYGLYPVGSLLTLLLFTLIYIPLLSGMGLIVSNYSNTMQQAMFITFFFIMILILISGLFTPISSMPAWAQFIASINPLTYFIEVMRLIFLKGSTFAEMTRHFFALLTFAVIFNVWAVISYKKSS